MYLEYLHEKVEALITVAETWPNIRGRGQAYCVVRMISHISIVLEQKAIVFHNIGVSTNCCLANKKHFCPSFFQYENIRKLPKSLNEYNRFISYKQENEER